PQQFVDPPGEVLQPGGIVGPHPGRTAKQLTDAPLRADQGSPAVGAAEIDADSRLRHFGPRCSVAMARRAKPVTLARSISSTTCPWRASLSARRRKVICSVRSLNPSRWRRNAAVVTWVSARKISPSLER